MSPLQGNDGPPRVRISYDERRVLDVLLDTGGSNAQIGRALGKTEGTVKQHMKRLLAKVGVATRTELVVTIMRNRVRLFVHAPGRMGP